MKRILLGLVAAAVIAFAGFNSASASTINVDPNPTDSFHVGNFLPTGGLFDDVYTFTLTHSADLTNTIVSGNTSLTLGVFNPSNTLVSFSGLLANVIYTLHITGFSGAPGGYGGDVVFTQVASTPLPSAVLLFVTSIAGLGAIGYRRRGAPNA